MTSPFPPREVKELAQQIADLRSMVMTLAAGQGVSAGSLIAVDGGSLAVKDSNGVVRQVIGTQPDGTVTSVDLNGPLPPTPVAPVVQAVPGGIKVTWSGAFEGGAIRPMDFAWVEVHVDLSSTFVPSNATEDAAITARGSVTFATDDYVPHTIRLVSRNTSKVRSVPSGAVTVTPLRLGPGDIAPGGVGTINLDDGAVTAPKSGTGVTSNLVPDPGFNDPGWRIKRAVPPWGFVDAPSVGLLGPDWVAFCPAVLTRSVLAVSGPGDIPVTPGESYFVAYSAARSASGAGKFWVEVTFYNSTGTQLTLDVDSDAIDPLLDEVRAVSSLPIGSFDPRHGQVVVPDGAAKMRVVLVRQDDSGASSGNLFIANLEVRSVVTRATTGDRVETSPSGILVFDANGAPIGSITTDGSLSMLSGQFDSSLTYAGTELGAWLDLRARGEIARVDAGTGSSPNTTTEVEWLEMDWTALPGRTYKLRSSGLVNKSAGTRGIQVRWTVDGFRPLLSAPLFTSTSAVQGGTLYLASDLGWTDTTTRNVKMLFTVKSTDGSAGYFDPADLANGFSVWIEDTGPRQDPVGGVVTPPGTGIGGGTSTAPDPTPILQTFTTSYNCTWSQSWIVGNKRRSDDANRMWQGYYGGSGGSFNGDQAGLFGFDMGTVRANLAGATISKLEIYLFAEHWYYNSGGNVQLGTSPASTPPGSFPATTTRRAFWHLNKPEGRWVDLGAAGVTIGNEIRDGSTGSFVLDPRPLARNLLDYGYFVGHTGVAGDRSPGLRITYTKAV